MYLTPQLEQDMTKVKNTFYFPLLMYILRFKKKTGGGLEKNEVDSWDAKHKVYLLGLKFCTASCTWDQKRCQ